MTYQQTLDFMFSQLPMYQRIGAAAYKNDIQPTLDLMIELGHPEIQFRTIHVAGTNGKGSVSHMLASILQEAGYKVGLYTSPHLTDFRERIRINGEMIPQEAVTDFVEQHYEMLTSLSLSFFEMTVGMAFEYFAREKVDVAVIEVGMGGRLDSTNVIRPELSIITNIGLDHTQFLGDTLEKIAVEKAGIIKESTPVVIGQTQPETQPVFDRIAAERNAPITYADSHWVVAPEWRFDGERMTFALKQKMEEGEEKTLCPALTCGLIGPYQKWNIVTVAEAVYQLCQRQLFKISDENIRRGLDRVVENTHLMGRWQIIGHNPLTVCETAHNFDGINAMMMALDGMQYERLHIIYGCVNDKDYRKILRYLQSQLDSKHTGKELVWRFSQPSVPRGLPVDDLVAAAKELGIDGKGYTIVKEAIAAAREDANQGDFVLVTGSIFLVADALA